MPADSVWIVARLCGGLFMLIALFLICHYYLWDKIVERRKAEKKREYARQYYQMRKLKGGTSEKSKSASTL